MSALALIAAYGMAQAAPAPAPSPLFAAFRAPCSQVRQFDRIAPAAKAAGWVAASADIDPRIVSIAAKSRAAMAKAQPGATITGTTLRQRVDGRTVWLVTSRVATAKGGFANGCRVYDLDAPAAPPRQTIDAWVGAAPSTVAASGTATKRVWEPWQAGTRLEITYVPRNHPLGASLGIQGLILVSQSIGGF